jgi:hypothetical protein
MQKAGTHFEQVPKAEIERMLAQQAAQREDHCDDSSNNEASNLDDNKTSPKS